MAYIPEICEERFDLGDRSVRKAVLTFSKQSIALKFRNFFATAVFQGANLGFATPVFATWGILHPAGTLTYLIDLAKKYYESRHSGLDPESSSQPVNTTFRTPLDTGFCRYDVYTVCSPDQ